MKLEETIKNKLIERSLLLKEMDKLKSYQNMALGRCSSKTLHHNPFDKKINKVFTKIININTFVKLMQK